MKGLIVIYFTVIYLYFKTKAIAKDDHSERNTKLSGDLIIISYSIFPLHSQAQEPVKSMAETLTDSKRAVVCKTLCTASPRLFSSDHCMANCSTK